MKHAIIIGAAKCGTTSLYHMLGQHSEICPGLEKEPDYFGANPYKFTDYASIWPNYTSGWALEASTMYTSARYTRVSEAIYRSGIQAKFIYLMRNPWDRIESLMRFLSSGDIHPTFIESSNYLSRLETYAAAFGRESLLPVMFEDLVEDAVGTVNKVTDFLELDREPVTPVWELKTKVNFSTEYLESSYRKSRRQYAMQQLAVSMQQLKEHWGVDIARWGF